MFKVIKYEGKARRGKFKCAHGGEVQTPVFMNVGTQAAISAAKQPAPPAVSSHVSRRSRRRVSRRIRSISRGVKPAGSSGGGTCRTARRIASLCSIHLVVYQYI